MQITTKTCSICHKALDISEFYKDASRADGRTYSCKSCHKSYNKKYRNRIPYVYRNHSSEQRAKIAQRERNRRRDPQKNTRYLSLIARHKKNKPQVQHDLTRTKYEDLLLTKECPSCGKPLTDHTGILASTRSFDRICNDLGLTDDNTWVICNKCNARKGDYSGTQLLRLANAVLAAERKLNK